MCSLDVRRDVEVIVEKMRKRLAVCGPSCRWWVADGLARRCQWHDLLTSCAFHALVNLMQGQNLESSRAHSNAISQPQKASNFTHFVDVFYPRSHAAPVDAGLGLEIVVLLMELSSSQ